MTYAQAYYDVLVYAQAYYGHARLYSSHYDMFVYAETYLGQGRHDILVYAQAYYDMLVYTQVTMTCSFMPKPYLGQGRQAHAMTFMSKPTPFSKHPQ